MVAAHATAKQLARHGPRREVAKARARIGSKPSLLQKDKIFFQMMPTSTPTFTERTKSTFLIVQGIRTWELLWSPHPRNGATTFRDISTSSLLCSTFSTRSLSSGKHR